MVFLQLDPLQVVLQVAIASATGATFVAIVGVAVYQAWLNRAWLDVELSEIGEMKEDTHYTPGRARVAFLIDVLNRSRRDNKIHDVEFCTTEPEGRLFSRDELDFHVEPGRVAWPIAVPSASAIRLWTILTVWEPASWFGKDLKGHVRLRDIHRKVHQVSVSAKLPDGPIQPEKSYSHADYTGVERKGVSA